MSTAEQRARIERLFVETSSKEMMAMARRLGLPTPPEMPESALEFMRKGAKSVVDNMSEENINILTGCPDDAIEIALSEIVRARLAVARKSHDSKRLPS